jgi:hypothetical protein
MNVTRWACAAEVGSISTPAGRRRYSRSNGEAVRTGDRAARAGAAAGGSAFDGPGGGDLPPVSIQPSVLQGAILTTKGASAGAVMVEAVALTLASEGTDAVRSSALARTALEAAISSLPQRSAGPSKPGRVAPPRLCARLPRSAAGR